MPVPKSASAFTSSEARAGWLFIGPWAIGFLVLTVYPFVASFYWSFCRYDLLSEPVWIGGENYRRIAQELFEGGSLSRAVGNTAYYACWSVLLSILLGVGLAVMLSWDVRGRAMFRTLCYLPAIVPVVAATVLWMALLDPQQGIVNGLFERLGLGPQGWFQSTAAAAWPPSWPETGSGRIFGSKDGLVLMGVWGVGNLMVIYLAALAEVPQSLYESAELDGAGRWRQFWHITLPMLSPVIFFNLVIGLIQSIQAFTQIYLVSDGQGDPAEATLTISLHLFLTAFKELDMGYASALAWVFFVVVLAITAWLFHGARRWVHHQGTAT